MARKKITKVARPAGDQAEAVKRYLETAQRYNDEKTIYEAISDAINATGQRPIVIGPGPIPLPKAELQTLRKQVSIRTKALQRIDRVLVRSLSAR